MTIGTIRRTDFRRATVAGMGRVIAFSGDQRACASAPPDGGDDASTGGGAWGAMSESLWPAWNGMLGAEARVLDAFGDVLGEKLLVLWALSRFGDEGPGDSTLAELVDDSGRPRFGDLLAEDMLLAAFSLAVAWADGETADQQTLAAGREIRPRL